MPPQFQDAALDAEVTPPEPPVNTWREYDVVSPVSPSVGRAPVFSRPGRLDDGVDRMTREADGVTPRASVRAPAPNGHPGYPADPPPPGVHVWAPENGGLSPNLQQPSVSLTPADRPHDAVAFNARAGTPIADSPTLRSPRHSQASSMNDSQGLVFDVRLRDSAASPVTDSPGIWKVTYGAERLRGKPRFFPLRRGATAFTLSRPHGELVEIATVPPGLSSGLPTQPPPGAAKGGNPKPPLSAHVFSIRARLSMTGSSQSRLAMPRLEPDSRIG